MIEAESDFRFVSRRFRSISISEDLLYRLWLGRKERELDPVQSNISDETAQSHGLLVMKTKDRSNRANIHRTRVEWVVLKYEQLVA